MTSVKALPSLGPDYISKFFRGDIVVRTGNESRQYTVLRCWADEDMPELPPGTAARPEDRPLLKGEVGISSKDPIEQVIVPESTLTLWTRTMALGEVVKKSLTALEAATVIGVQHEYQVEHVMSGQKITEWIPEELLVPYVPFAQGDKVIYKNWIGTVETVVEVAQAWLPSGETYTLNDWCGLMQLGKSLADIQRSRIEYGLESQPSGDVFEDSEANNARLVRAAPLAARIHWNAINQHLKVKEQDHFPKPRETLKSDELFHATRQLRSAEPIGTVGAVLQFRKITDARRFGLVATAHPPIVSALWAVRIARIRSKAKLEWQDGSITEEWTSDIVLHERVDDDDYWPGDHVRWFDDDRKEHYAVVQAADPHDRTVDLLLPDTQTKQTVSVLELVPGDDSEGPYGFDVGSEVMLCADNGSKTPYVPGIGDDRPPPDGLEDDMWAQNILMRSLYKFSLDETPDWKTASPRHKGIDWYGEVVKLETDGKVTVRWISGKITTVELKQLYALLPAAGDDLFGVDTSIDGDDDDAYSDEEPYTYVDEHGEPLHEMNAAAAAARDLYEQQYLQHHLQHHHHHQAPAHQPHLHHASGRGRPAAPTDGHDSDRSWQTTDDEDWDGSEEEDGDVDMDNDSAAAQMNDSAAAQTNGHASPDGVAGQVDVGKEDDAMSEEAQDIEMVDPMTASSPVRHSAGPAEPTVPLPRAGPSRIPDQPTLRGSEHWIPFEVVEAAAPRDHHFFSEASAGPNRTRMSRLNKEHKALRNSLPENILVRTYENRMDLMRVMIMGPEGTPYGAAPFVFDVFLHANYPFEPPVVHFHSHTNGKGRCNPNLYEDGKVCLSILGTWAGDASESWNPQKSSLLQVFVSISGLVLVRNPYHCEPAFAKLEGTKEGMINSRQYSEKAYVLSRQFIRQALLFPPVSLEAELKHYYLAAGRLKAVIDHARTLMDKESDPSDDDEGGGRWNADAIGSLTKGAKLSLKRTIESLEEMWVQYQARSG